MAELRSIKPPRVILAEVVAQDLRAHLDEAIEAGATGYTLIYESGEDLVMRARINAPQIRRFIGFIEADVKPTMIGMAKGDG